MAHASGIDATQSFGDEAQGTRDARGARLGSAANWPPRARLYRPTAAATTLVIYLHGGGWVIGDLYTHDRACGRLAATSGVSVLALDYRRAREHRSPAVVDDAVSALQWFFESRRR